MYTPARDGIDKTIQSVCYREDAPPPALSGYVHCFWELKTDGELSADFELHATPDACVDIMFNELNPRIAGVTSLRTTYEVLNLGRKFHYVGIQFLPGVWNGSRDEIAHEYIGEAYTGRLPLIWANREMVGLDFDDKMPVMAQLVESLVHEQIVVANPVMETILAHLDDIHTVAEMAEAAGLSPRQLQRTLKKTTGFTPHDLLKVLRLQRPLSNPGSKADRDAFADQAHFIRSFRHAAGYTPGKYAKKFN